MEHITRGWKYGQELYQIAIHERGDTRTAEWLLSYSPWGPISVSAIYIVFCLNARRLTARLPVFDMRPLLVVYNFFMVTLSAYMFFEFLVTAYLSSYQFLCQPVDFSSNKLAIRMAKVFWLYYFSKYIELIETVMFALRKKYNQISFLHCYHHTSMILIMWLGVKYVPGGQSFIFGCINSFVHVVMYVYYGLSAVGPHMHKYLWWKKYITYIQLSQFIILATHSINNLVNPCQFPTWLNKLLFMYAITLGMLFLNFFFKTYLKARPSATSNGDVHRPKKLENGHVSFQNGYHKASSENHKQKHKLN